MCNLTDHFNEEEMMKDPQYISYMDEKFREMKEYHDWYIKSLERQTDLPVDVFIQEQSEKITEDFEEVYGEIVYDVESINELINKL